MELANKRKELGFYLFFVHGVDRPKLMFANGRRQLGQRRSSFSLLPQHLSGISLVPASRSNVGHRVSRLKHSCACVTANS